jgi:inner membrane protein
MPTAFTHALVGGAVAQTIPQGLPRWRLAAMFAVIAAIPDLDVITFAFHIPYSHMFGHRGFSHSLLFALILGILSTLALSGQNYSRRQWLIVCVAGFLAAASHGLLDAATDAGLGVGLFIPFTEQRYFFNFRPIATSSVNPLHFFTPQGLAVMKSELLWVWAPVGVLTLCYQVTKLCVKATSRRIATQREKT